MIQQIASLALAAALFLPAAPAFSASGPEAPEPLTTDSANSNGGEASENIESIEIIGQRQDFLRYKMQDFILEIGEPVSSSRGYARWQGRVCVGVFNLPDQAIAQYIADKITVTALELGLPTGSPGCQPNLQIIFSPDARELAGRLVDESPLMFRPFGNTENTTQGRGALEQFKTSDAPVRWWQITMVVDETGMPAMALPGLDTPNVRAVASRLKNTVNDAIWGGLIIVDARKLNGIQWPQLAEYLAMVSLAQIEPGAQPDNHDSILNLFSAEKPPLAMTDMDRSYLRALYEMDTMMLPHTQRGVFTSMMVRVQREMEGE